MANPIVGEKETFVMTFTDSDGTATDPTDVTLQVKVAETTTTYTYSLAEITKDSTGVYSKEITYSTAGWLYWEWQGTGTVAVVTNGNKYVEAQLL